jgi:hypothetical protein
MKNRTYTLYAVEQDVGEAWTGSTGQHYHAFLALVDETIGNTPKIIDEINFVSVEDGIALADTRRWKEGQDFAKDYNSRGLLGGSQDFMLELWDKAENNSRVIESLRFSFSRADKSPTAINCRAAIIALIKSLGL